MSLLTLLLILVIPLTLLVQINITFADDNRLVCFNNETANKLYKDIRDYHLVLQENELLSDKVRLLDKENNMLVNKLQLKDELIKNQDEKIQELDNLLKIKDKACEASKPTFWDKVKNNASYTAIGIIVGVIIMML